MENQRTNRGDRYSEGNRINYSKVFAVIIAIIVVVIFILAIKLLLGMDLIKNGNEFFALYDENKWGVIDSRENIIITPSYAEMIAIPDSKKDIFICTYNINEQTGEYKTKVLNKKNKEIFTEYEQVEALENYDEGQNVWYEEDVLRVKQNGKYGLISFNGNKVLDCEYSNIYTLKGIKNSLIVEKEGKLGLVDNKGRKIADTEYAEILALGTKGDQGYITVNIEGKYGIISYTAEKILQNNYEYIEPIYGKNMYVITENGEQKLINSSGDTILENGYDKIKAILLHGQIQGVIYEQNNRYGIIRTDGNVLIQAQYDNIKELENGLLVAEKEEKYGIIDLQNDEKLPFSYTSINYNKESELYIAEENTQTSIIDKDFNVKLIGILSEFNVEDKYIRMRIQEEYQYYDLQCNDTSNIEALRGNTLFLKQENGKYGYVNSKGETVVDCIYDDATEQNRFGYVAVKKNGHWGSLDNEGKEIIAPKYELTNNIIIDFIGEWHLGEDLNMKYYCKK